MSGRIDESRETHPIWTQFVSENLLQVRMRKNEADILANLPDNVRERKRELARRLLDFADLAKLLGFEIAPSRNADWTPAGGAGQRDIGVAEGDDLQHEFHFVLIARDAFVHELALLLLTDPPASPPAAATSSAAEQVSK